MTKKSPNILLICEAPLTTKAGGISQTLANIFSPVNPNHLLVLSAEEDVASYGVEERFKSNTVTFKKVLVPFLKNRIGLVVNKYLRKLSLQLLSKANLEALPRIKSFKPDCIIICPNGSEGVIIGQKVLKHFKLPFFVYLMDDWIAKDPTSWLGSNLQKEIKNLLIKANGWIMISEYLNETLAKRYSTYDKPLLVLHNPVTVLETVQPYERNHPKEIGVSYAGALWPMHLDAFLAFAGALRLLQSRGYATLLTLYCSAQFWEMNKIHMTGLPVVYGGFIPYKDLYSVLSKHEFALVCSSFLDENKYFSMSSVQTKITDYLNVGRTILSVGPEYGACNKYLEKHHAGFSLNASDSVQLADQLSAVIENKKELLARIENGRQLIKESYRKEVVSQTLERYLSSIVPLA